MGLPLYLSRSTMPPSIRKSRAFPITSSAKCQGLIAFLVQEVRTIAVAIQVRGRNRLEIRLSELLTRLEGDSTRIHAEVFGPEESITPVRKADHDVTHCDQTSPTGTPPYHGSGRHAKRTISLPGFRM